VILDDPTVIERWRRAGWWGTTTIDELLRACVASRRDQLALVDAPNRARFAPGEPQRLTFGEVGARVDRLAAVLYGAGVRKDTVVLVQLPNIVEIVIAFLAFARLGAIVSPVMLAYGERDMQRILRHVRPAAILTLAAFRDARPALHAYLATIAIDANAMVTMHWTSGTTGDPRCVPRSHNQWHATGSACTDGGGLQSGERILAPMQMVHTAGYSGMFMPWLQTQGLLAMHQPFDMAVFLEQIESLRINHTIAAPSMLNALLRSGAPAISRACADARPAPAVPTGGTGSRPWSRRGCATRSAAPRSPRRSSLPN
jgi:acyl-coenzyme A synthetase/AMP-(fatty) acid ligase